MQTLCRAWAGRARGRPLARSGRFGPGRGAARDVHRGGQRRQGERGGRRRRARRRAPDGRGHPGRGGADARAACQGRRERREGQADAQQERPDSHPAGAASGRRRLQRLPLVGRARRHPRRAVRDRAGQPADRQARGPRADAPGPRDHRPEGHRGRPGEARRQAPRRPLLLDPARARVDQHRGQPPAAAPLRRRLERQGQADPGDPQGHRAVVRRRREPGRLPVHVRPRPAVAQEPARQRRRRRDHRRRRRRPEPQLRRDTGATTTRAPRPTRRTRPIAVRAPPRSPRRGRWRA